MNRTARTFVYVNRIDSPIQGVSGVLDLHSLLLSSDWECTTRTRGLGDPKDPRK